MLDSFLGMEGNEDPGVHLPLAFEDFVVRHQEVVGMVNEPLVEFAAVGFEF
jgi:hypothetical protein